VAGERSGQSATDGKRRCVVIAEDNAAIRDILSTLLVRRGGFDVTAAEDGLAALESLRGLEERDANGRRRLPVDLLVLDIMMPRMTGLDVLRALREEYGVLPTTMVISALDDEAHVAEALQLGAIDYLLKPIDSAIFLHRVHGLVEGADEAPFRWAPIAGRPVVMVGNRTTQARAISEAGIIVQCPSREAPAIDEVVPLASPIFAEIGVPRQLRGRVVRTTDVGVRTVVELWFVGLRARDAHDIRRYAISR